MTNFIIAQMRAKQPATVVLAASVVLGIASLGLGGYNLLTQGHAAFNTTNLGVPWGLPIVTYDYFVVASTGLAFLATLALAFGVTEFYPVAKRCLWLALATLVAGGSSLMLELGHPLRSLYAIPLNLQYASPMFWKVLFIGAYVVLLLILFYRITVMQWTTDTTRPLAIGLFVAALGIVITAGALFGMMAMRPFWHDGLMPIYFLVEGLAAGLAFAILATYIAYGFDQTTMPVRLRKLMTATMPGLFAIIIGVQIVMLGTRALGGVWSNAEGLQVWHELIASPWFWLELVLGLMIPFLFMVGPMRVRSGIQTLTAVLVLVGGFIGRYDFVIGGQIVPLFKGSWAPAFIQYGPSFTEWMLTLLAISVAFGIYAIGELFLDLSQTPEERADARRQPGVVRS